MNYILVKNLRQEMSFQQFNKALASVLQMMVL